MRWSPAAPTGGPEQAATSTIPPRPTGRAIGEPNHSDIACIGPGALVAITRTPPQMPAELINQGMLCLYAPISVDALNQGASSGHAPVPPVPKVTTTAQCPAKSPENPTRRPRPPRQMAPRPNHRPSRPTPSRHPGSVDPRSAPTSALDGNCGGGPKRLRERPVILNQRAIAFRSSARRNSRVHRRHGDHPVRSGRRLARRSQSS
jgi:hypothetical protein